MDIKKINQVDAAKGIGIDRSRFNLLLNDKVGVPRRDTLLKISDFFGCDIEWLVDGQEKIVQKKNMTGRIGKIIADIRPGDDEKHQKMRRHALTKKNKTQPSIAEHVDIDEREIDISDMIIMTAAVLKSETVYRSALASNVRAFYQAVINEDEMKSVAEQMKAMRDEMKELKDMLVSIGVSLPQKREQG